MESILYEIPFKYMWKGSNIIRFLHQSIALMRGTSGQDDARLDTIRYGQTRLKRPINY